MSTLSPLALIAIPLGMLIMVIPLVFAIIGSFQIRSQKSSGGLPSVRNISFLIVMTAALGFSGLIALAVGINSLTKL